MSKDLVTRYIDQVWNQGRTALAEHYVAADLIQHNPGLADGREPLVALIAGLRAALPNGRFEVHRVIGDGDLVVVHSTFSTGTDADDQAVVDIFRVVDDRIVEHWDVKEPIPGTTASGRSVV